MNGNNAARDRLLDQLNADELSSAMAQNMADDVVRRYRQNNLPYHNLDHITGMLDFIAKWADLATDLSAINLATWFHDIVYDSRASDNEAQSAQLAVDWLGRLHIPPATVAAVRDLILVTATHQPNADHAYHFGDGQLLIDADLAILGAPSESYDAYAAAIRAEYAWVPEEQFRHGRRQILQRFLQRSRIYQLPAISAELELQARANLTREQNELS